LQSATNPESGTVSYAYNFDYTVAAKTDAKGQKVVYTYDGYQRATLIQRLPDGVNEDLCQRTTISYDSNSVDPSFGQNLWGRPAVVVTGQPGCPVINFNPTANASAFSQMYSYTAPGLVTNKRLRVTRSGRIPGDLDVW
jgi:YD repeat-containing protein